MCGKGPSLTELPPKSEKTTPTYTPSKEDYDDLNCGSALESVLEVLGNPNRTAMCREQPCRSDPVTPVPEPAV